jgi:hypothetical protein
MNDSCRKLTTINATTLLNACIDISYAFFMFDIQNLNTIKMLFPVNNSVERRYVQ